MIGRPRASVPNWRPGEGAAEVATPIGIGRHCLPSARGGDVVAETFPVQEEERLIPAVVNFGNPDRATERPAVIVLAALRLGIHVRFGSVQRFVVEILV